MFSVNGYRTYPAHICFDRPDPIKTDMKIRDIEARRRTKFAGEKVLGRPATLQQTKEHEAI